MIRTAVVVFLLLLLVSCKSSKTTSKKASATSRSPSNNRVITEGEPKNFSVGTNDRVIFKGSNNTVYLEYLNSFFNSKDSKDVIIIEGDGNTFRLTHCSTIDNSSNSADTIVLKGDYNHIEFLQEYLINNSKNSQGKTTLEFENEFQIIDGASAGLVFDSTETVNKISNEWMTLREAHDFYVRESLKNNLDASFYLGEMYEIGVGSKRDIKKAIYYYNRAANKGHVEAQSSLAYVYERDWDGGIKDIKKAKYWYEKAAAQGNEYAIDRLKYWSMRYPDQ